MIDALLLLVLAMLGALAAADARAVYKLHRCCLRIEAGQHVSPGLLRWYADGFERPLHLARWLLRAGVAWLIVALMLGAHPLLIAVASVGLVLIHQERRYVRRCRRRHLLAQSCAAH